MLYLIGLGIWDEEDISVKGLSVLKNSDIVYAELYTANWGGSLEKLSEICGKEIMLLERSGMEEDAGKIIEEAKERAVSVLVPGDPLVATTHIHLVQEAKGRGIDVKIIHSSSIFSAIAATGLQIYKFGRVATVVAPTDDYAPDSFYDVAAENKKAGLHTLMLLDVKMSASEGAKILLDIEKKKESGFFSPNSLVLACSRLGSEEEKIIYTKAETLAETDLPSPAVIIIPGELHFAEEEAVGVFN
ncbi:MAG: diphthine synthase [Candidatus Micrarchaeota archaeon]|nr:diphthine synthase [Candidatus Micrarchaeota archaeon]